MKKVIKFLPALAILLASGLAIATTKKMNEPNVFWEDNQWKPLTLEPHEYECLGEGPCTAYIDENDVIWNDTDGVFTRRPNN